MVLHPGVVGACERRDLEVEVMTVAGILTALGLIGIGYVLVVKANDRKGL